MNSSNFSFSLIFLGDTHGFIDDFEKQKEVIDEVNPEFVLCEKLENISLENNDDYAELFNKRKISNITDFEEVGRLMELCHKKNIKMIGIDLRNFGFDELMQSKVSNQEEFTEEEQKRLESILKERENRHVEMIEKYLKKSNKSLLVIIGSWHLRDGSRLLKHFDNYKVIFPCNKSGDIILEPINEKISYCEEIK